MYAPERLMTCTNVPNESNHKACESREVLAQEEEALAAWMQTLEDLDGKNAANGDGDIQNEHDEFKIQHKRPSKTG